MANIYWRLWFLSLLLSSGASKVVDNYEAALLEQVDAHIECELGQPLIDISTIVNLFKYGSLVHNASQLGNRSYHNDVRDIIFAQINTHVSPVVNWFGVAFTDGYHLALFRHPHGPSTYGTYNTSPFRIEEGNPSYACPEVNISSHCTRHYLVSDVGDLIPPMVNATNFDMRTHPWYTEGLNKSKWVVEPLEYEGYPYIGASIQIQNTAKRVIGVGMFGVSLGAFSEILVENTGKTVELIYIAEREAPYKLIAASEHGISYNFTTRQPIPARKAGNELVTMSIDVLENATFPQEQVLVVDDKYMVVMKSFHNLSGLPMTNDWITVQVQRIDCPIGFYLDSETLVCQECKAPYTSNGGHEQCVRCDPDYYTLYNYTGEVKCRRCPTGASCAGGLSLPTSKDGYWGDNRNPLFLYEFYPCDTCRADFQCKTGFTDRMCDRPANGYMVLGSIPLQCPSSDTGSAILTVFCLVTLLAVWILINVYLINKYDSWDMILNSLQLCALVYNFSFPWEKSHWLATTLELTLLDVDFIWPTCGIYGWSWATGFWVQQAIPFAFAFVGLVVLLLQGLHEYLARRSDKERTMQESFLQYCFRKLADQHSLLSITRDRMAGVVLAFVDSSFNAIVLKAFQTMFCDEYSDGHEYLRVDPSMKCHTTSHRVMQVYGIFAMVALGAGYSLLPSYLLNSNKEGAPDASVFRVLGFYFDPFRGRFLYWYSVWHIRAAIMVVIVTTLTHFPSIQGALGVFCTLLYGFAAIHYKPCVSGWQNAFDAYLTGHEVVFILLGMILYSESEAAIMFVYVMLVFQWGLLGIISLMLIVQDTFSEHTFDASNDLIHRIGESAAYAGEMMIRVTTNADTPYAEVTQHRHRMARQLNGKGTDEDETQEEQERKFRRAVDNIDIVSMLHREAQGRHQTVGTLARLLDDLSNSMSSLFGQESSIRPTGGVLDAVPECDEPDAASGSQHRQGRKAVGFVAPDLTKVDPEHDIYTLRELKTRMSSDVDSDDDFDEFVIISQAQKRNTRVHLPTKLEMTGRLVVAGTNDVGPKSKKRYSMGVDIAMDTEAVDATFVDTFCTCTQKVHGDRDINHFVRTLRPLPFNEWCRDLSRKAGDFRAFIRTSKRLAQVLDPSNPHSVYASDSFWWEIVVSRPTLMDWTFTLSSSDRADLFRLMSSLQRHEQEHKGGALLIHNVMETSRAPLLNFLLAEASDRDVVYIQTLLTQMGRMPSSHLLCQVPRMGEIVTRQRWSVTKVAPAPVAGAS